uniref:Uncharacterized protein n=1 Tax=Rhizophora mucronata TaxID=61149 RepID=A0A2P2Q5C5_RHIMU
MASANSRIGLPFFPFCCCHPKQVWILFSITIYFLVKAWILFAMTTENGK